MIFNRRCFNRKEGPVTDMQVTGAIFDPLVLSAVRTSSEKCSPAVGAATDPGRLA